MLASLIYKADLSDRKEICVGLLRRLTADQQKAYLLWCIAQLAPIYRGTKLVGPVSGANESWHWFTMLCTQYALDYETARLELLRRVRAVGTTREVAAVNLPRLLPGTLATN